MLTSLVKIVLHKKISIKFHLQMAHLAGEHCGGACSNCKPGSRAFILHPLTLRKMWVKGSVSKAGVFWRKLIKPMWGDSHYGDTFVTRLKVNLGWKMQTVKALTAPQNGILVPEGEEMGEALSFRFPPTSQKINHRALFRLDLPLASSLSLS